MSFIYRLTGNRSRKYFFITVLLSGIFIILLMNLGRFFDITVEPKKADIIVYLGGGSSERLEKSLELYKLGYSKTNKIIYTGPLIVRQSKKDLNGFNKKKYLKEHGISEKNIIYAEDTGNTMKEVLFVKNYMLEHHYKSVIFISDPYHSRRIMFLAKVINNYDDANLSCVVVGSDVKWWDRIHYYKNKKARRAVISEISKLVHNTIAYGVLQKFGLLEVVKETFAPLIHFFRVDIYRYIVGPNQ